MKKVTLLIFLLAQMGCLAQTGYLGKKISLQTDISLNAYPYEEISNLADGKAPGRVIFESSMYHRRILVANHLGIGITIGRQWEFIGTGTYRSLDYAAFTHNSEYYKETPLFASIPVREISTSFGFRKYIRGALSPVGGFFQFAGGISTAKTAFAEDSLRFEVIRNGRPVNSLPSFNSVWRYYHISIGMGIKKVLNDHFFFQFEGTFNIPVSQVTARSASPFTAINLEGKEYMDGLVRRQMIAYQVFYAKFGLGVFLGKSTFTSKNKK